MADKKTKREYFEELKGIVADNAELVEFIDAEIARIDNRNEKAKEKRAEKAVAGDALRDAVKTVIVNATAPITAEEVAAALVNEFEDVTKAKVTYRATQLIKAGKIFKVTVKTEDGRKVVAYTAEAPADAE